MLFSSKNAWTDSTERVKDIQWEEKNCDLSLCVAGPYQLIFIFVDLCYFGFIPPHHYQTKIAKAVDYSSINYPFLLVFSPFNDPIDFCTLFSS